MSDSFLKGKTISRRSVIIGGAQGVLMSSLVMRLGYLQLAKFDTYKTKSDTNRIRPFIVPPARGIIYDSKGVELALNNSTYQVLLYIDRNQYDEKETLNKLSKILNLSTKKQESIIKKVAKQPRKSVITILDNLLWHDIVRVEVNSFDLPGIATQMGEIRYYPYSTTVAHLIGYVSLPSEKDIERNKGDDILFMNPNFRIGKNGIEKEFELHMRGKATLDHMEVNAYGIPIRKLSSYKGKPGEPLNLTINIELQKFIEKTLADLSASVVVMDVNTGAILSMVSSPSFDPNKFVRGEMDEYWDELINDRQKPLGNKALTATYPPGSTFKLMVALAALESGIDIEKEVYCPGYMIHARRKKKCWKEQGHGKVGLIDAIAQSCNVYFWSQSKKVGIKKISEMAERFGMREKFDISLPESKSGLIPDREWKKDVLNDVWVVGDTLNAAVGQGFVTTTPLQLAVMTSRIANGGVAISPYLLEQDNKNNYEDLKSNPIIDIEHIDIVKQGMYNVVNDKKGSAFYRRIKSKKYAMAGKTGTSQVVALKHTDEFENPEDMPVEYRNHALFTAFAPYDEPKYAISVVVEHGIGGSRTAAPLARDILLKAQKMKIL